MHFECFTLYGGTSNMHSILQYAGLKKTNKNGYLSQMRFLVQETWPNLWGRKVLWANRHLNLYETHCIYVKIQVNKRIFIYNIEIRN